MNTVKYALILLAGALLFASCTEDNTFVSDIEEGDNLAGFTNNSQSVANIANGDEYPVEVTMKLIGPSVNELSGDYTATIQPDWEGIPEDVRAEEGTHFRIDNNQVTFSESDNYLATFNFTMLTDGIVAPLENSPKLNLKVTNVSNGEMVIASGKTLDVTLNYACASNLQGTYEVTVVRDDGLTATNPSEEIVKTGVGEYVTQSVEYFFPSGPRGDYLNRGVIFTDVCGKLEVPTQNLGDVYSNEVTGTETGSVNGNFQTGELISFTLYYSVDGLGSFTATYVKL